MNNKKLITKTIVFIGVFVLFNIILRAYEPTISASIGVQQAFDTIDSSANIRIYSDLKNYSYIGWLVIAIAVYWKEIKRIFK